MLSRDGEKAENLILLQIVRGNCPLSVPAHFQIMPQNSLACSGILLIFFGIGCHISAQALEVKRNSVGESSLFPPYLSTAPAVVNVWQFIEDCKRIMQSCWLLVPQHTSTHHHISPSASCDRLWRFQWRLGIVLLFRGNSDSLPSIEQQRSCWGAGESTLFLRFPNQLHLPFLQLWKCWALIEGLWGAMKDTWEVVYHPHSLETACQLFSPPF